HRAAPLLFAVTHRQSGKSRRQEDWDEDGAANARCAGCLRRRGESPKTVYGAKRRTARVPWLPSRWQHSRAARISNHRSTRAVAAAPFPGSQPEHGYFRQYFEPWFEGFLYAGEKRLN